MVDAPTSLYQFDSQGRTIFVDAVYLHLVANESLPIPPGHPRRQQHTDFLARRARQLHGDWPTHVIFPDAPSSLPDLEKIRFSGVRVFASCSAMSSDEPEAIEKLIVVWHVDSVRLAFSECVSSVLGRIPWETLAIKAEY